MQVLGRRWLTGIRWVAQSSAAAHRSGAISVRCMGALTAQGFVSSAGMGLRAHTAATLPEPASLDYVLAVKTRHRRRHGPRPPTTTHLHVSIGAAELNFGCTPARRRGERPSIFVSVAGVPIKPPPAVPADGGSNTGNRAVVIESNDLDYTIPAVCGLLQGVNRSSSASGAREQTSGERSTLKRGSLT